MSPAIKDHAVLQRNADTCIWGKGTYEGQTVTLTLGDYRASGVVGWDMGWRAFFHDMESSAVPLSLTVSSDGESVTFSDILIGEVWLVTGQSNAEFSFKSTKQVHEYYSDVLDSACASDNIRAIIQHREDIIAAGIDETRYEHYNFLNNQKSSWCVLDSHEKIKPVCVLGYFFAKHFAKFTHIPVGIVMAGCSASPIQELMPARLAKTFELKQKRDTIALGGAFNTMIAPVANMTFGGVLFYQGESEMDNAPRHLNYDYILASYVAELRRKIGNVPFYYVQLSSHPEPKRSLWHYFNETRNVQFDALKLIPDSGMVVSRDAGWREGDENMYHPYLKDILGKRLCDLALSKKYGLLDENYVTSPEPVSAKFYSDRIVLVFKNAGDGLCTYKDLPLLGFEIKENGEYRAAKAYVSSKDAVTISDANNPCAVRFGFDYLAYPEVATLQNSAGLPCPCFELKKSENEGDMSCTDTKWERPQQDEQSLLV